MRHFMYMYEFYQFGQVRLRMVLNSDAIAMGILYDNGFDSVRVSGMSMVH